MQSVRSVCARFGATRPSPSLRPLAFRQPPIWRPRDISTTSVSQYPRNIRRARDPDIKYFEELQDGSSRKRRRLELADAEEDEELDKDIHAEARNLNNDGKNFRLPEAETEELARRALHEDDDIEAVRTITDRIFDKIKDLDGEEIELDLDSLISSHAISPQHAIPRQSQIYLDKLNAALDEASLEAPRERHIVNVWRWYERSKQNVPDFLRMIPKKAWDLIWKTQSITSPANPDRAYHLKTLAQDKLSAGWGLSPSERLLYIESAFLTGDQSGALRVWEDSASSTLGNKYEFLELGVRLYAYQNAPDRSHDIYEQLVQSGEPFDARVLIPLVHAFIKSNDATSLFKAWKVYQAMRERLGSDAQIRDFDAVTLAFLEAGHKDYALSVFRDMILTGQSRAGSSEAASHLEQLAQYASAEERSGFFLDVIKYLPRKFQNKFFYASWLRKLISEDQLEAAAQVIELMYERKINPDPRHMNGLISAWLRQGDEKAQGHAEQIAWAMIQRRIDWAKERHEFLDQSERTRPLDADADPSTSLQQPQNERRAVPPASMETLCIMASHYISKGKFSQVSTLHSLLDTAALPIDIYFWNRLILADARQTGYFAALDRFREIPHGLKANAETFAHLWTALSSEASDLRKWDRDHPGGPRLLFKRMLAWAQSLQGRDLANASADLSPDSIDGIVLPFALSHDLEGIFVVLHVLRQRFGAVVNETTMHSVAIEIAKLDQIQRLTPTSTYDIRRYNRRRRTSRENNELDRRIQSVMSMIQAAQEHRARKYDEEGINPRGRSQEEHQEDLHRSYLSFLFTVIKLRKGPMQIPDADIHAAAHDMGVEWFEVEPTMALIQGQ